jgi:hypothetical protein
MCGLLPYATFEEMGDELLRRGTMNIARLVRSFEAIPVSGRRKARPMKAFFVERVKGFDPGGSKRELDVMWTCRRGNVSPLPVQPLRVLVEGHTYYLDFAWPDTMHAIEFEGFETHGGLVVPFHKDRERTRRLQRAGWHVWPVTSRTSANEILAIAMLATAPNSTPGRGVACESASGRQGSEHQVGQLVEPLGGGAVSDLQGEEPLVVPVDGVVPGEADTAMDLNGVGADFR